MSGRGLHRKGKRKARKFHWNRPSLLDRLAQSARDRGLKPWWLVDRIPAEKPKPEPAAAPAQHPAGPTPHQSKPGKGFFCRLFNRKTGG